MLLIETGVAVVDDGDVATVVVVVVVAVVVVVEALDEFLPPLQKYDCKSVQ